MRRDRYPLGAAVTMAGGYARRIEEPADIHFATVETTALGG